MSLFQSFMSFVGFGSEQSNSLDPSDSTEISNPSDSNLLASESSEEQIGGKSKTLYKNPKMSKKINKEEILNEFYKFKEPDDKLSNSVVSTIEEHLSGGEYTTNKNTRQGLIKSLELLVNSLETAIENNDISDTPYQKGGYHEKLINQPYKLSPNVKNKVIGIITVPLTPTKRFYNICGDSYLPTNHLEWIKQTGLKILPIPYDLPPTKYNDYFKQINGLYIPEGGIYINTHTQFLETCSKFLEMAMEANDKGEYFPVWGVCMGFQQLLIIADGNRNHELLDSFDSFNHLKLPLIMTKEAPRSNLFRHLYDHNPDFIERLSTENITINNHMMGLSPEKFQKSNARNIFKILSYNYDRNNQPFISTIEGIKYPFYGVQWHPELDKSMKYFIDFFANEVAKNNKKSKINKSLTMVSNVVRLTNREGSTYKTCSFFWHNYPSKTQYQKCQSLDKIPFHENGA
jgi:gamma-glutamyl hydrolase